MNDSTSRFPRRALLLGAAGLAAGAISHRSTLAAPAAADENSPSPVRDPASYRAYVPAASKTGPFYQYTCEFDAAWAVLKTYGIDATFEDQLAAIRVDDRVEPWYEETADGVVIHGGDITSAYSGDYTHNYLARTTGAGMRHVFKHFGLRVTHVHDRDKIERNLERGRLIWIKATVDFKDWVPATWLTPEGTSLPVVLGNDHAVVVMGYDDRVVVIRDVLGPTSTNWERPYEYEVEWETFLRCWAAQGSDGLAVGLRSPSAT
jgi:Peptidase_C39 like family